MRKNELRKIMIVEDEQIIATDLAHLVGNLGYNVSAVVESGEQALESAMTNPPDLALMDIVLQGKMDGIETASTLRKKYNMPIVFITAYADETTIEKVKHVEPQGYILKPFTDRDIETTLEVALHKADAERRIKRHEELLSAVLESVESGVIAVDEAGFVQLMNPVASRLSGWSESEAIGRHIRIVLRLKHNQNDVLQELLSVPPFSDASTEFVLVNRNGVEFTIACTIKGAEPESAISFGHVITLRDITQRKQAEETLRDSEERFRATFYSIADAIITTDTNSRVVRMNRTAESLTGWIESQARGKRIEEVVQLLAEDGERPAENLVRNVLLEGRQLAQSERIFLVSRDGKRYPVSEEVAPLRNFSGDVSGAVLVFNDQTEQRELEAKFLQSQKMEAMGRLAGGIAHDFNNMLGVIMGYASMMESAMTESDPNRHGVETIISAAERSASLTRQLLALARRQIATPVTFNLNLSLRSLQRMLPRLVGENIVMDIRPGADLWNIKIDPSQVDQILTNLATNARDAIEDVGTMTIETRNVVIDESAKEGELPSGEYVLLMFADSGKGMDKPTLERIFEPYFTTKPTGKGTGLGLSTVFGIVKQNNGFIHIESEPQRGTAVKIFFPRVADEMSSPSQQEEDVSRRGTETILIVEDEVQLLEIAKTVLMSEGYDVLTAKTPAAALELCNDLNINIDLLLTDVVMPEMNGRELQRRIAAIRPGLKVIFMSGYTADTIAQHGILDDGIEFLPKPFTLIQLTKKVRDVLNGITGT